MKILHSGLPVFMRDTDGTLSFEDGLICDGSSSKTVGQMEGLIRNPDSIDREERMYEAYRNIRFPEHESLFHHYDFRYDITVIQPGTVNGEFKKTSGHYHGYIAGGLHPYPEVYEVIHGEILFILQKSHNFDRDEEPVIEELKAVHVKEGESIIIPPYCGHGSINPTDGISMFSNLAVVSCPLHYGPVQKKHGLAACAIKDKDSFRVIPNENYHNLPPVKLCRPVEEPSLGIAFGVPCYNTFLSHPERYDFLLHPDSYMDTINQMTEEVSG
ncbi:glucose-6-phosphate isomerase family protein [Lachnospiraceae bacterium 38-10]